MACESLRGFQREPMTGKWPSKGRPSRQVVTYDLLIGRPGVRNGCSPRDHVESVCLLRNLGREEGSCAETKRTMRTQREKHRSKLAKQLGRFDRHTPQNCIFRRP